MYYLTLVGTILHFSIITMHVILISRYYVT